MWMIAALACGTAGGDSGLDEATQATLDELNTALDGYETWDQVADWEGVQPSESVHGDYTEVWLNADAFATVSAAAGEDMPDGAILAKQAYNDAEGTDLGNLTAMYKVEGAWFWASWDSAGELVDAGDVSSCSGCHSAGQDSVLVTSW